MRQVYKTPELSLLKEIRDWLIYQPNNFVPAGSYAGAMLRQTCKEEIEEFVSKIDVILKSYDL